MRILSRYFLASYLRFFATALLVSLVIVIIVEMLVNFEQIVERQSNAEGILRYLLVRVPSLYLRDMIPAASFVASFLCLGIPALRHEVTAIKAGGIAPRRIAAPVLLAAAALSILTLFINETVLLGATRELTRLEHPDDPLVFSRDSFWYHRGNTFYNVREADRNRQTLRGVQVFELDRSGRLVGSIRAERVDVVENRRWRMLDATRRRFDPSAPARSPRVERIPEVWLDVGGSSDLDLLDASEHTLSLLQLADAIERRSRERHDATRYRALLHARLAAPATVFVFALLAVPVGLSVTASRSIAVSALYGISTIAAFHALWYVGTLMANRGFAFAAASPWLVLALFATGGALVSFRATR